MKIKKLDEALVNLCESFTYMTYMIMSFGSMAGIILLIKMMGWL